MTRNELVKTGVERLRSMWINAQKDIVAVAPRSVDAERLWQQTQTAVVEVPKLLQCDPRLILAEVKKAVRMGLEIAGPLGEAYVIPYGDRPTLVLGYKGLMRLAYRSPRVAMLDCGMVRADDAFEYELGTRVYLKHVPSDREDGSSVPTHAYAIARLKGGESLVRVMTFSQIERHRKRFSRAANRADGPWSTSWDEMAQKTVLRKLCKLLPLSAEGLDMIHTEEYAEAGVPERRLRSGDVAPADDLDALAAPSDEPEQASDESVDEPAAADVEIPW